MKYYSFVLTMPQSNSWNGKWSGEDRLYCVVVKIGSREFNKNQEKYKLLVGDYYYNFGDGWGANVEVKEVDSKTAAQLKRKSNGFCGYNWMISSVLQYGKILNSIQIEKLNEASATVSN